MNRVLRLALAGSAIALLLLLPACSGPGGRPSGRGPGECANESAVDHSVTRQEYIEEAGKTFDRLDTNKDGLLTPEERRCEMQRQGAPGRGDGRMGDGRGGRF